MKEYVGKTLDGMKIFAKVLAMDGSIDSENKKYIFNQLTSAKIFILDEFRRDVAQNKAYEDFAQFDIPFETCFFEMSGDKNIISFETIDHNKRKKSYDIVCILIKEMAPNLYAVSSLIYDNSTNKIAGIDKAMVTPKFNEISDKLGVSDETRELARRKNLMYSNLINEILSKIHNSKFGEERTERSVILKSKHYGNVNHKPGSIIRICSEKNMSTQSPIMGKEIQWLNRWWTRGHWRKHEGTGKNRAGERIVDGFTWVTEHIRGPEDAPILEKTYHIKNE